MKVKKEFLTKINRDLTGVYAHYYLVLNQLEMLGEPTDDVLDQYL